MFALRKITGNGSELNFDLGDLLCFNYKRTFSRRIWR